MSCYICGKLIQKSLYESPVELVDYVVLNPYKKIVCASCVRSDRMKLKCFKCGKVVRDRRERVRKEHYSFMNVAMCRDCINDIQREAADRERRLARETGEMMIA